MILSCHSLLHKLSIFLPILQTTSDLQKYPLNRRCESIPLMINTRLFFILTQQRVLK
ncbi:hypothetical protein RchiOBHm_Chr7g0210821 [Rosa chinensis]|uniref:Uncharacterized protein n=1 Tax=Rosa chinensis TaxID=74649 RepID=A0A2P6PAB1_ROSCH|nr:hypothetical protein RchiOBHm_Chr7g0210821 [Rosa chinensis]